ncbi:Hsp20 family protein [Candidatus Peregrinibacteria bacterium]|nr:Hsp20 family protein [Candidatus Peregrinibacteria bacterium]
MKHTSIKINPGDDSSISHEVGQLSLDIYQTDKELVILAPIAGVKEKDLKVSITDDTLVIRGERSKKEEVSNENYFAKECFWGAFSRAIVLPEDINISKAVASFNNNVLEIRIPKSVKEKTKVLKIKAS